MSTACNEHLSTVPFDSPSSEQPPRRVFRGKEQWKALVSEYENSNLSQAEFCKIHGIASSGLYKWRKHFANNSSDSGEDFINVTDPLMTQPVTATPSTPTHSDWQVELQVGAITVQLRAN